jgi:hypothetical protein
MSETFEVAKLEIEDQELLARVESFFSSGDKKEGDLLDDEFGIELQYCNILQSTTTSIDMGEGPFVDIKYGDFFLEDTPLGNEVELIPLVMWSDRAYFVKDNPAPVCKSPDGITPMDTKFATKCENCQFGKWDNNTKTPPKCTKALNVLFIPSDFRSTPFVYKFSRTGAKVGKDIVKVAKRNSRAVYETTFTLTTKQETKNKRRYYVPVKNASYLTDPALFPALKFIQSKYLEVVRGFTTRHHIAAADPQSEAPTNIE